MYSRTEFLSYVEISMADMYHLSHLYFLFTFVSTKILLRTATEIYHLL